MCVSVFLVGIDARTIFNVFLCHPLPHDVVVESVNVKFFGTHTHTW